MNGNQQGDGVNAVSDSTKCQSPFNTESVDESSTEETEDGEGRVESGVLLRKITNQGCCSEVLGRRGGKWG